mmetsp:Transcript_42257/g.105508  ORF Transcript_42257/g.105508 Transcript_42257/m.105508 type:complete len:130 (-) Transcript_42257:43-432(-)
MSIQNVCVCVCVWLYVCNGTYMWLLPLRTHMPVCLPTTHNQRISPLCPPSGSHTCLQQRLFTLSLHSLYWLGDGMRCARDATVNTQREGPLVVPVFALSGGTDDQSVIAWLLSDSTMVDRRHLVVCVCV